MLSSCATQECKLTGHPSTKTTTDQPARRQKTSCLAPTALTIVPADTQSLLEQWWYRRIRAWFAIRAISHTRCKAIRLPCVCPESNQGNSLLRGQYKVIMALYTPSGGCQKRRRRRLSKCKSHRNSSPLSWWTSPRRCSVQAERRRCWAERRTSRYRRPFSMSWGRASQSHRLYHSRRPMNCDDCDCLSTNSHQTSSPGLAGCCKLLHNYAECHKNTETDFELKLHTTDKNLRCFNTSGWVTKTTSNLSKVTLVEQKLKGEKTASSSWNICYFLESDTTPNVTVTVVFQLLIWLAVFAILWM